VDSDKEDGNDTNNKNNSEITKTEGKLNKNHYFLS